MFSFFLCWLHPQLHKSATSNSKLTSCQLNSREKMQLKSHWGEGELSSLCPGLEHMPTPKARDGAGPTWTLVTQSKQYINRNKGHGKLTRPSTYPVYHAVSHSYVQTALQWPSHGEWTPPPSGSLSRHRSPNRKATRAWWYTAIMLALWRWRQKGL